MRAIPTIVTYNFVGTSATAADCAGGFNQSASVGVDSVQQIGSTGFAGVNLSTGKSSIIGLQYTADAEL